MGVTTTQTNKPFNPRGNDQSPLAFNRAKLFSGKALDFDGVNDYVATSFTLQRKRFRFICNRLTARIACISSQAFGRLTLVAYNG